MAPTADQLADAFKRHFQSADREIEWLRAEVEHSMWLAPGVLLVGRIDAIGRNAEGHLFFGEWKTASKFGAKNWKLTYRLNPQTLTYGVLINDYVTRDPATFDGRGCERFTVRKAFKADPPTCDFAWFRYAQQELDFWRRELLTVAHEIRQAPVVGNWPTNFNHCFRYGPDYACPFFDPACSKQQWEAKPADALVRISHLDIERRLNEHDVAPPGTIVLDATRVNLWFECRERFRREYIDQIAVPPGEALKMGIDFHQILGDYYQGMIKEKEGK